MKRLLIPALFAMTALLWSCGSDDNLQKLEKQLEKKEQQLRKTEAEIKEMKEKIASMTGDADTRYAEPVVANRLQPMVFRHFFEASGAVEPVREAFVSPEINGQISAILVKEGDAVTKGQLLARINTDVTERSIDEARTALRLASDVFERQKRLWEQRIGSEIQFLEAKNNKESLENRLATLQAQLDMANIVSPISGYVERVHQKAGELGMPGMVMMHLVDLSELLVRADVSERYLPSIKRGDEVVLRFPSFPDFEITTNIERVGNVVNRNNRTFEVLLRLSNDGNTIKPNMVAVIQINDYTAENSLVVPSMVIKEDLNGKYLYTAEMVDGDMVARKRYIVPGRTYLATTRIETGLEVNDRVIFEGFNRVNDGSLIRLVNNNIAVN